MSALTDVAKQAMEYFCDRGSVDTYSEEWGFYLALRDALAQEPNPQMREKSLVSANSAYTPALQDAAQQALEALEWHLARGTWGGDLEGCAASLRAALEQEQAEPVAWMCPDDPSRQTAFHWQAGHCDICGKQRIPLYAAPPQRKPLTEEEAKE